MNKEIFIVNINDYMPEVFRLTYPTVLKYAEKIGAKVTLITERKYPEVSITYEKVQIYELGRDNDFNILIDADIAIGKYLPDVATIIPNAHVGVHMSYIASVNFPCDKYFFRDARNVAIASDFMVVPRICHDVWTPLENPLEHIIKRPFILDEFCFSRNLAKFGLKYAGIIPDERFIFHLNKESSGSHTMEQLHSFVSYFC